jgi:hypothetical protein
MNGRLRSIAALALLGACGSGVPLPFVTADFAIRCDELAGVCGNDARSFADIAGFSGQDGLTLACEVVTLEEDATRLDLSIGVDTGVAVGQVDISNARLGSGCATEDGCAPVGDTCETFVQDDDNSFAGTCGADAPTAEVPCQLFEVRYCQVEGDPAVQARLRCAGLRGDVNPALIREITASGFTNQDSPMRFRITDCSGLESLTLPPCPSI